MTHKIRIADDYACIREALLALKPKAPAIVHAGNLMPVSAAHLDVKRYAVVIGHRLFLPQYRESNVVYDERVTTTRPKGYYPGNDTRRWTEERGAFPVGPPILGAPSMTLEQIDRWNALRSHTGMVMQPVLSS